jgi:hypothetical protein
MEQVEPRSCRVNGCGQSVLPTLASEYLCLDHFLNQTSAAAKQALQMCQQAHPLDPRHLEWLLSEAHLVVKALTDERRVHNEAQRGRVLELLLCLANLHEYVAHHAVRLQSR